MYRFDAGHGSLVIEETIRQVEVALAFALRTVPPGCFRRCGSSGRRSRAGSSTSSASRTQV